VLEHTLRCEFYRWCFSVKSRQVYVNAQETNNREERFSVIFVADFSGRRGASSRFSKILMRVLHDRSEMRERERERTKAVSIIAGGKSVSLARRRAIPITHFYSWMTIEFASCRIDGTRRPFPSRAQRTAMILHAHV